MRRLEGDIPYRVFVKNRLYPGRVFLPFYTTSTATVLNITGYNASGLAMSRAIGDTVGAQIGIIPDPDVRYVLRGGAKLSFFCR